MKEERKEIKVLIKEAVDAGAKQSKACEIVGISEKTLHRWSQADNEQDGRLEAKHKPVNKLTEQECEQIAQNMPICRPIKLCLRNEDLITSETKHS